MADNDKFESKVITSLKDIGMEFAPETLDLTEDAWEFAAPVPAGYWDLKLFLAKDGMELKSYDKDDPKAKYIQFTLEAKVETDNEDYKGATVFTRVNTRIYARKNISTMAGLIVKMGYKLPNPITANKLAEYMLAALKKEPIVKAELDWRASYETEDSKGNKVWETACNHYDEFPWIDEKKGIRNHIVQVTNKKTGAKIECKAQVNVVRFFAKGEALPNLAAKAQGLVSAPRGPQMLTPQVLTPTPAAAAVQQILPTASVPVQQVNAVAQGPVDDGDLELLMQE